MSAVIILLIASTAWALIDVSLVATNGTAFPLVRNGTPVDALLSVEPEFVAARLRVALATGSSAPVELLLVRTPSVGATRTVLTRNDVADLSTAATAPAAQQLSASAPSLEIPIAYACNDSFTLLDAWSAAVRPAGSADLWTFVAFEFAKDCRRRGCAARCAEHGRCNELRGVCECNPTYFADECQLQLTITDACPGGAVSITWNNPGDRDTSGDWYALYPRNVTDRIADQLDWRYFATLDKNIDAADDEDLHQIGNYTAVMPNDAEPGEHVMIVYKDDSYEVFAEVPFFVKEWSECNVANAACADDVSCSGHGKCGDDGACECDEGWSFVDCSRGCTKGAVSRSTDAAGRIVSGVYNNEAFCVWEIAPAVEFDSIELTIESLFLDPADFVRIEKTIEASQAPAGDGAMAPTLIDDGAMKDTGPKPSEGFQIFQDVSSSIRSPRSITLSTSKPVRIVLHSDSFNVANGLTASYAARKGPRVLTGGEIAGIVIGCVAAVALLVILAVFLTKRLQARAEAAAKAAEQAANTPATGWTAEQEEDAIAEKRSRDNLATITTGQFKPDKVEIVRSDADVSLFTTSRSARTPVAAEQSDTFTLVNKLDKPLGYEISVPIDEDAFKCTARPGTGVLAPLERREIKLTFTLSYTCTVWRYVKVTCDDVAGFAALPIVLEGEPSLRLDPNGIELFGKPIGDGAFGVVYRGRWRGTEVAVKVPKRQGDLGDKQLEAFSKEIALFEKLRNPYIVNFIGASHVVGKLCICTELLERGTVQALVHRASISTVLKIKLMLDTANALAFLHANGVLYRDLKTENLLVFSVAHTAAVNCKLADFGTAIAVADPLVPMAHSRAVGTPIYMAPEIMVNQPYNVAVDIYSLAILCWEILAETQPFQTVKRLWELPKLVLGGARPAFDSGWDSDVCELIGLCWLHSPSARPSAAGVVKVLDKVYSKYCDEHKAGKISGKLKNLTDSGERGKKSVRTGELNQLFEQDASNKQRLSVTGQGERGFVQAADMADNAAAVERISKKSSKKDKLRLTKNGDDDDNDNAKAHHRKSKHKASDQDQVSDDDEEN